MSVNPGSNEKDLLSRIAAGDESAFRELFNRYRGKLYSYIYKMTDSRETAEDTVHDVFLKIWESRKKLPDIDNLNAYLHQMAHNRAYTGFRRMAKETLILAELKAELENRNTTAFNNPDTTITDAEARITSQEVRAMIKTLVDKLTPQQKQVYLLSRERGMRQDAIAAEMNISVNTVKNHLGLALRFLREELGQHYGPQAIAIFVLYNLYMNGI